MASVILKSCVRMCAPTCRMSIASGLGSKCSFVTSTPMMQGMPKCIAAARCMHLQPQAPTCHTNKSFSTEVDRELVDFLSKEIAQEKDISKEKEQPEKGEDDDGMDDLFEIDQVAVYEGEMGENTYRHSAEVMDGNLYELLMDVMDERGIDSEFIDRLTQFSTTYEHNKYVKFLEDLQSFVNIK